MTSNNKILLKCKKIKIVLTDVDGVLTDGGRYYSENGEVVKRFNVRDGMGVNLLLKNGIKTVIVTKEDSKITKRWAKDMNVSKVYSKIIKKEEIISNVCKSYKVTPDGIAFIGDDVNDMNLMKKIGLSATPSDGINDVKKIADYVCKSRASDGAFRELADLVLKSKFPKKTEWY